MNSIHFRVTHPYEIVINYLCPLVLTTPIIFHFYDIKLHKCVYVCVCVACAACKIKQQITKQKILFALLSITANEQMTSPVTNMSGQRVILTRQVINDCNNQIIFYVSVSFELNSINAVHKVQETRMVFGK